MAIDRSRRSRWWRTTAVVAVAVASLLGACSDGQDPGLDQQIDVPPDQGRPTSNTLGSCPAGGPDATTPAAGCLDDDGTVLRP